MRLRCRYRGDDNAIEDLAVELLEDGGWQPFVLDAFRPGFLIFLFSLFNCQHLYLRANAAERGLLLDRGEGSFEAHADADWRLQTVRLHFRVSLRSGAPGEDDRAYIIERMRRCPVSVNVPVPDSDTVVEFL